jgi:Tfp pilus assembly protein PilN
MRYVALLAIVAALTVCLGLELLSKKKLEQRNAEIAEKQRELKPLAGYVAEVEAFSKKKDDLQRRIDWINQLKQRQSGPRDALHALGAMDSVATERDTITINRRSAEGRVTSRVRLCCGCSRSSPR